MTLGHSDDESSCGSSSGGSSTRGLSLFLGGPGYKNESDTSKSDHCTPPPSRPRSALKPGVCGTASTDAPEQEAWIQTCRTSELQRELERRSRELQIAVDAPPSPIPAVDTTAPELLGVCGDQAGDNSFDFASDPVATETEQYAANARTMEMQQPMYDVNYIGVTEKLQPGAVAPVVTEVEAAHVSFVARFENLGYSELVANEALLADFVSKLKWAIATESGCGVSQEHVELVISAGSVVAHARVTPSSGGVAAVEAIQTGLVAKGEQLAHKLVAEVQQVPGIAAISKGPVAVAMVSAPTVQVHRATPATTPSDLAFVQPLLEVRDDGASVRSPIEGCPPPPVRANDEPVPPTPPGSPLNPVNRVFGTPTPSSVRSANPAPAMVPQPALRDSPIVPQAPPPLTNTLKLPALPTTKLPPPPLPGQPPTPRDDEPKSNPEDTVVIPQGRNGDPNVYGQQPSCLMDTARESLQLYMPRAKPDGTYDAFIVYSPGTDRAGRDNDLRAAAVARGLQAVGISVRLQARRAGSELGSGRYSSDEAHLMAQAAKCSGCAVVLLTRRWMDRVEAGVFGDTCSAGFALAKRLPCVIVAAMEPDLVSQDNWGWNRVFARFSGRAIADLSMNEEGKVWDDAVAHLSWFLTPEGIHQSAGHEDRIRRQLEVADARMRARLLVQPSSCNLGELEAPQPPPAPVRYDCFLSHTWARDICGRENHKRVLRVAQSLRRSGLEVFFDEWEMHRYRNFDEAMVDGMRHSAVVVIFITKAYIDKIEDGSVGENCVAEFNLAKRTQYVIPVIMESPLRNSQQWGWNRVYAHLSGRSFIDLSFDEGSPWTGLFNDTSQRWTAAVDTLELRVRSEAAAACAGQEEAVFMHGAPPVVPFRDVMFIAAWSYVFAALLFVGLCIARFCRPLHRSRLLPEEVLSLSHGLLFAVCFAFLALWHVQRARLPPQFAITPALLPRAALFAAGLGCASSLLVAVRPLMSVLTGDSGEVLLWGDLAGAIGLLVTGLAAVVDALFLSEIGGVGGGGQALARNGGIHDRRDDTVGAYLNQCFAFGALAKWAMLLLLFTGCLLVPAETATLKVLPGDDTRARVLKLLSACSLLMSALLFFARICLSPKYLRRYYERDAGAVDKETVLGGGVGLEDPAVGKPDKQQLATHTTSPTNGWEASATSCSGGVTSPAAAARQPPGLPPGLMQQQEQQRQRQR